MGWYIALGILVLLAIFPLGISICYDAGGFLAKLIAGPVRLSLYPRKNQEKKKEKEPEKQEGPKKNAGNPPAASKPKAKKGGSLTDFLPMAKLVLRLLNDFRRKIRVNRLEAKLVLAGEDPCDLAVNYGRAWAAVGNVLPQLERVFKIKKRSVEVEADFRETETRISARLDVTITLGRLVVLAVVYGFRALKEYRNMTNKRKGGAVT